MAKDQKDNEMEDYAAYYGVPFKSYDEILEARRRAGRRRKGYLVLGLLVAVILCAGVFIGLFSGNLLVKRVLAGNAASVNPSSPVRTSRLYKLACLKSSISSSSSQGWFSRML